MRGRLHRLFAVAMLAAILLGGYAVADAYFLPEEATTVMGPGPENSASVLKAGSFSGAAGHDVSGQISIVETDGGYALQFENYEQTQGPDVYVYLTPSPSPNTSDEIDAGIRIRIDGGADDGESTKEGTFRQPLPDDIDPDRYDGVAIWCDQFGVPFGYAALEPVDG